METPGKVLYKILRTLLMISLSFIVSYLFMALILSLFSTHPPRQYCNKSKEVFITTNGIHLDIIIPVVDIDTEFANNLSVPEGTKYVAFGWGDKDFYINTPEWSDLKFHIAFKSLFLKSESAMHVTFYPVYYSNWKQVELCPQQIDKLKSYIQNSFKTNIDGDFEKLTFPGYSYYDCFFGARGSFSLFRTCNVWVTNGLKKASIKTSVWSPFDFGVIYHLPAPNQSS